MQRPIDHGAHGERRVRPHQLERRHLERRRCLAGEHREADRRELPLIGERRRRPRAVRPFARDRHEPLVRNQSARDLRGGQRPLPADDPEPSHRRRPHGLRRHRAVRRAEVVQIAQRRSRFAEHAHHARNVVRPHAAQSRADRFAGDPAAQISGPATAVGERRPVVVRRRHRRVVAMRELARFGLEPRVVARIGCAHQRQRPAQRIDHFLVVSMLGRQPVGAPTPPRRKLPAAQMLRQLHRGAVEARLRFGHPRRVMRLYSLDSERICAAAASNSGTSAMSGSTATSTTRTDFGVPSDGADDASDGTCTVTETTRHSVLGRVGSPVASTVSS